MNVRRSKRPSAKLLAALLAPASLAAGCTAVLGVSDYSVAGPDAAAPLFDESDAGGRDGMNDRAAPPADVSAASPDADASVPHACERNRDCQGDAAAALPASDAGPAMPPPYVCVKPEYKCVPLLTPECSTVTGSGYTSDDAVFIGSLFSIKGALQATNIQRQQAATLAVSEINQVGGLPSATGAGNARPLVMISCDAATDVIKAANHLANDLHVPAIVGPNTSQDTLNVSSQVTVAAGTVIVTPSAISASIVDLVDNNLTWLMVPSDAQRAPLMERAISDLAAQVVSAAMQDADTDASATPAAPPPVKLSILYRNDALGQGTSTSLSGMTLNGKPLSDPSNINVNVQIAGYDPTADFTSYVATAAAFGADIVVLAGTAEVITSVMVPLEAKLASAPRRPYYVVIDPAKGPDLLKAIAAPSAGDLRQRVRGVGVPGLAANAVSRSFNFDYSSHYGSSPTASGSGPSYDATYAIAYGLAALRDAPLTGKNLAATGLRKLAGGPTPIGVGSGDITRALASLASGDPLSASGTYGPLEWNAAGAPTGGLISVWCVNSAGPAYADTSLTYDLKSGKYAGAYGACP